MFRNSSGNNLGQAIHTGNIGSYANYYTHPTAKQCNYNVDLSNYYTKREVDAKIRNIEWALGAVVMWDNKLWFVCHKDYTNNRVYLIAYYIVSKTIFGSNSQYAGSTLAQVAMNYQNNNMSAAALAQCVDVTVNGVTSKVFVPSYEQMRGGLIWFNISEHRKTSYQDQSSSPYYWTSSADASSSDRIWRVHNDGSILSYGDAEPDNTYGFRPCVCVQL